ncbi:MAG: hypothetical protein JNL60_01825 [Bacteroidia bacterium]|nr:hypothetical protein [Bacteroidia bacterium]
MKDNSTKRKILQDRHLPGAEQIDRYKNFDHVMQNYNILKKLTFRKMFSWGAAAICAAGITTALITFSKASQKNQILPITEEPTATAAFIQPPLPGKEILYSNYRISAKNGGTIHHFTGSEISIPGAAFENSGNISAADSIDIRYREFHDPLDIFLSGIPMTYDSAGTKRNLESAGMIEIRAFNNNRELQLEKNQKIQILMASSSNDPKYNLYELDTIRRNWIYRGKDHIKQTGGGDGVTNNKRQAVPAKELNLVTETKPSLIKPVLNDPKKYSFKIDFDKQEFPELSAYENVLFEVSDVGRQEEIFTGCSKFKSEYYQISWTKILLLSSGEPGIYIVKLKKADTTISLYARPVFDEANYNKALEAFEAKHKQAVQKNESRTVEEQEKLSQVNAELAKYKSAQLVATERKMITGANALRTFSINRTGVYNIDRPLPPPPFAILFKNKSADTKNKVTESLNYGSIYLVEKGKNTVYRFTKGEAVRCNPTAQNLMWTVTDNNNIVFFRSSDYKNLMNGVDNIRPEPAKNQVLAFNEIRRFSQN